MKICAILSILAVLSLAYGNPALGYVVTVEVEGVVTDVNTYSGLEFDGSVVPGSTIMTGSYTYDTETPDQSWPESTGLYSVISVSMTIGNYTFIHNTASSEDAFFYISVDSGYCKVVSPSGLFSGPCWINGEPYNLEDLDLIFGINLMYLDASSDDVIVSDALPDVDSFPELSLFDVERTFFGGNQGGPMFIISGEITSITVIPEPASALLFGLGGLALLRKRGK